MFGERCRSNSMDRESVCGLCGDSNSWSVDGSLGREVRGRVWVMSDFIGYGKEFVLYFDGSGIRRG